MPLRDELMTIERTLWTNNRQISDARLEDNAVLVFPETGVMRKPAALEGIDDENVRWPGVPSRSARVQSARLALGRGRVRRLTIDQLHVGNLRIDTA
jgi:hypothetical protein